MLTRLCLLFLFLDQRPPRARGSWLAHVCFRFKQGKSRFRRESSFRRDSISTCKRSPGIRRSPFLILENTSVLQTEANRGRKTKPGGKAVGSQSFAPPSTRHPLGVRHQDWKGGSPWEGGRAAGGDWHLIFEVHRGCHSSLTRFGGADSDTNQLVFNQCNRTRWAFFEAMVAGAQL